MKSQYFLQAEFETEMARHLSYKDQTPIADAADVSQGVLSAYFSNTNERQSPMFKAACIFTAWIDRSCDDGQRALAIFNSFIARSLPCTGSRDIQADRSEAYHAMTTFELDEAQQKPLRTRIEDLEASIAADNRLLDDLRSEEGRYQQREAFPNQPVSHGARTAGQRAVRAARGE